MGKSSALRSARRPSDPGALRQRHLPGRSLRHAGQTRRSPLPRNSIRIHWSTRVGTVTMPQWPGGPHHRWKSSRSGQVFPRFFCKVARRRLATPDMQWDANYIYISADITDTQIVPPPSGRTPLPRRRSEIHFATRYPRVSWIFPAGISTSMTLFIATHLSRRDTRFPNGERQLERTDRESERDRSFRPARCPPHATARLEAEARIPSPCSAVFRAPPAVRSSPSSCRAWIKIRPREAWSNTRTSAAPATRNWPYLALGNPAGPVDLVVDERRPQRRCHYRHMDSEHKFSGGITRRQQLCPASGMTNKEFEVGAVHADNLLRGSVSSLHPMDLRIEPRRSVPVIIATTASGTTTQYVNQQTNGQQWVSVGTYTFNSGTNGSVTISNADVTGEHLCHRRCGTIRETVTASATGTSGAVQ